MSHIHQDSSIMKRLFLLHPFLITVVVCIVSGCSHTYPVTFTSEKARGDTVSAGTLNQKLANKSVTLITRDGRELSASDVLLTRDSCHFTETTGRSYVRTGDVVAVRNVDHFSSAVGGFGLGLVGGFVVGMGAAYLVADGEDADSRMGAGLLGISITVAGSLVGLVVGAAHGTVTDYTIPEPVPDSSSIHPKAP
jgi:hypothetical protein